MMKGKVLLISDNEGEGTALADLLSDGGFSAITAESANLGGEMLESDIDFDVAMVDIGLQNDEIHTLLDKIGRCGSTVQVVMISDDNSTGAPKEAIEYGAFEYLQWPQDRERALMVAGMAVKMARLARENNRLKGRLMEKVTLTSIVAEGREMMETRDKARTLALLDTSVVIIGESGSGKRTLAEAIHNESPMAAQPFVFANILPGEDELGVERRLFGDENDLSAPGMMEKAQGGTLYICDISLLSARLQSALQSVIQRKEFSRVGGDRPEKADFRLVAGSGSDLAKEMNAGRFREDLYYHLNLAELHVPPLRRRKEDISALARVFLKKSCDRHGRKGCDITPDAMNALTKYRWPGNIRELEDTVDCMLSGQISGKIRFDDLPDRIYKDVRRPSKISRQEAHVQPFAAEKSVFERQYLVRALEECEGNITVMARITDLSRPALYEKLRKYGLK
ncbi:MAG: sigma-54 dependent transcriptional regulator [Nitrospinota bacterium]|nr:sigma-54 dependent transcriptional regulator [Nitrospinota bacterium]